MADYNDYLAYLHHVDDTTLQEFKKKEDELRHQIDVVREQCKKDIKSIKESAAAKVEQLKVSHEAELAKLKAEKDAAVEKLSTAMAQIEEGKRLAIEQALAKVKEDHESTVGKLRFQYQSSIDKLNAEIKQLKESHEKELQRITAEKDAQIAKLSEKLAKIEAERFSFRKVVNKIKEFVLSLFMSADSNIDDAVGERKRLNAEKKARQQEEERRSEDGESRHGEENEPVGDERRFCRICGNPLKPGAVFCNKCGTKVS